MTTFGPGALVDLPRHSVVIGGLETWSDDRTPIFEERLEANVSNLLGIPGLKLFGPPIESNDPSAPPGGVTAFQFPTWFVAQYEDRKSGYRARPLVHRTSLTNDKYEGPDRKKVPVVPVRFVQGCVNGHISDIDWYGFAHSYTGDCRRSLWIEEHAPSGDLADVFIRCECGQNRSMAQATRFGQDTLGFCEGRRPWLGADSREKCGGDGSTQPNRLLIRSASDAYFPQVLSVISLPDVDAAIRAAVDKVWEDFLSVAESPDDVRRERKKARVGSALTGLSDEAVWAEIERRRGLDPSGSKTIKQAEIETLLAAEESMGEDAPEGVDFFARRLPLDAKRTGPLARVERVLRLFRLREVIALVGFTRFEPQMTDIDGELSLNVTRAPLARDVSWLPAYENRGEGFFLSFGKDTIAEWTSRPAVKERACQLEAGIRVWRRRHANAPLRLPGTAYILLHSLSHLLITAVSLECGYSASSIRERIYAGDSGYGILLHTGSPDSEGTLGGLVQVSERLEQHLDTALRLGQLCSNDPVCAQHQPDNPQEERFLHGAACHGCLLIAESSCERRNEFLDRALVVPTVEDLDCELFRDEDPRPAGIV